MPRFGRPPRETRCPHPSPLRPSSGRGVGGSQGRGREARRIGHRRHSQVPTPLRSCQRIGRQVTSGGLCSVCLAARQRPGFVGQPRSTHHPQPDTPGLPSPSGATCESPTSCIRRQVRGRGFAGEPEHPAVHSTRHLPDTPPTPGNRPEMPGGIPTAHPCRVTHGRAGRRVAVRPDRTDRETPRPVPAPAGRRGPTCSGTGLEVRTTFPTRPHMQDKKKAGGHPLHTPHVPARGDGRDRHNRGQTTQPSTPP